MTHDVHSLDNLPPVASQFYRNVMDILQRQGVGFLIGGGHAFYRYTSISRDTKDFDIFVMRRDTPRILELLRDAGYQAENKYPHWLAKVYHEGYFVDVICSSGNGVCPVDELWFTHATDARLLGRDVRLAPVEEMIWQKAFIMERHRYDGADIMHLLHHHSERLDWERMLKRFQGAELVLFSHLLLYRFTYPGDASPRLNDVLRQLAKQLGDDLQRLEFAPSADLRLCRGTLLSLLDYLPAVQRWGYLDARLLPFGTMTPADVEQWTSTFER